MHDVRVESGLLIASYCAKDQRLVHSSAGPIVWQQGRNVIISAIDASSYLVSIHTLDGRQVMQSSASLGKGETAMVAIPTGVSGPMYAVVTTPRGTTTLSILLYNLKD